MSRIPDDDFIAAMQMGLPPIAPPVLPELTPEQMAEGDMTEERR